MHLSVKNCNAPCEFNAPLIVAPRKFALVVSMRKLVRVMVDKVVKKFDDVLSHVDTVVQYMSVTNRWTA